MPIFLHKYIFSVYLFANYVEKMKGYKYFQGIVNKHAHT